MSDDDEQTVTAEFNNFELLMLRTLCIKEIEAVSSMLEQASMMSQIDTDLFDVLERTRGLLVDLEEKCHKASHSFSDSKTSYEECISRGRGHGMN